MRYATFMRLVEEGTGLLRPEAERAAHAVLRVLARRITLGEADDIAAFLPPEFRHDLTDTPEPAERFDVDEFARRVAELEGVDERTALEHARAVFRALGQAVAPGELRDMAAQLPADYEPLLREADIGRRAPPDPDDVVARVARTLRIDPDRAQAATDAVLETLAIRISAGEVEDLIAELPGDLRPPLERGVREQREAVPMTADEFVARVAEREGVSLEDAEAHARAVFAALRDVISSKEFEDMAAQLSSDYEVLLT
jgi:uncharacterized protein (DUF2267 family)